MYHPKARLRYPKGHLWSRGKFATSLGFVQIEVVNEYVRNQDKHHGTVLKLGILSPQRTSFFRKTLVGISSNPN